MHPCTLVPACLGTPPALAELCSSGTDQPPPAPPSRYAVKSMPKRFTNGGQLEPYYVRRVRNEVDICNHLGRCVLAVTFLLLPHWLSSAWWWMCAARLHPAGRLQARSQCCGLPWPRVPAPTRRAVAPTAASAAASGPCGLGPLLHPASAI